MNTSSTAAAQAIGLNPRMGGCYFKVMVDYESEKLRPRLRQYGLTVDRYREILGAQGGACAICRRSDVDLTVDHNHETWVIRGLICRNCNTAIGLLADSIDSLQSAILYLQKQTTFGVVPLVDAPRNILREMLRSENGTIVRDRFHSGKVLNTSKRGRALLLLVRRGYCERLDADLYRITDLGREVIERENKAFRRKRQPRPMNLGSLAPRIRCAQNTRIVS